MYDGIRFEQFDIILNNYIITQTTQMHINILPLFNFPSSRFQLLLYFY